MGERRDLLIEIGTEELPPKALRTLCDAFAAAVAEGLAQAGLDHAGITPYGTPRRLALLINGLAIAQPDKAVERRGPALTAAFDEEGNATAAARGFARSCGVEVEQLEELETDKGAWLIFRSQERGRPAEELFPAITTRALDKLPIPKRMRWGALKAEFVRPVHWVVMLFGDTVIDAEILGARAGRETRGHRFHHPAPLYLGEPAAYAPLLETEGRVLADFAARREAIRAQILEAAAVLNGTPVIDEALLDEVTGLVEWPAALVGSFDERYLKVPSEALISAMKNHQKFFHVVDDTGQLLPHFITISNIESREPAMVRGGNERVIRPRLEDAAFFWDTDRKRPLASRAEALKDVVFEHRLGTLWDKSQRVQELAATIAKQLGGDAEQARRAAVLAKCDLLTSMVGEFPELQGVMGSYYARHDGESEELATALDEQYLPRFAGDDLPQTLTGQALALADRVDTLAGIFTVGLIPSGDKDPFALRRAALGCLRILIEQRLDLDLLALLESAAQQVPGDAKPAAIAAQVYDFMLERLRAYYLDAGFDHSVFEAVRALRPPRPYDFDRRMRAVALFRELPEAAQLAEANKRIHNILKKAGVEPGETITQTLLQEPGEQQLAQAVAALAGEVTPLLDAGDYEPALQRLAGLRDPVGRFFDEVMVMADDVALRNNRLALLNYMHKLFLRVADLSQLLIEAPG